GIEVFDAAFGHAMLDERQWLLVELVADHDRLRERLECQGHPGRVLREDRGDRLPRQHLASRLCGDHESDGGIHRVLDLQTTAADGDDGAPDDPRLHPAYDTGTGRVVHLDLLRLRQHGRVFHHFRVATLRFDDLLELL